MEECLDQLKPEQHKLIKLSYAPGETAKSAAKKLNRSTRATQTMVARIRMILQECIETKVASEDQP